MKNIYDVVLEVLSRNEKYLSEENQLLKAKVYADIMSMDKELLTLLMTNEKIKKDFFSSQYLFKLFKSFSNIILIIVGVLMSSAFFIVNILSFIKSKYDFEMLINPIKWFYFLKLNSYTFYGFFLLSGIIFLFILNFHFNLNNKIQGSNNIPSKSGSNEYGSAKWAEEKC